MQNRNVGQTIQKINFWGKKCDHLRYEGLICVKSPKQHRKNSWTPQNAENDILHGIVDQKIILVKNGGHLGIEVLKWVTKQHKISILQPQKC